MTVVNAKDIILQAAEGKYAVRNFNITNLICVCTRGNERSANAIAKGMLGDINLEFVLVGEWKRPSLTLSTGSLSDSLPP